MADLTAVCNGIASVLSANVPGLRVSGQYVSQVNPPQAIVIPQPQQSIRFETLDGGICYLLRIILLASYTEDSSSVTLMNSYLATTGTNSIANAIRLNPRLPGVYDYIVMEQARGYGLMTWAAQEYLGCQITVSAYTS